MMNLQKEQQDKNYVVWQIKQQIQNKRQLLKENEVPKSSNIKSQTILLINKHLFKNIPSNKLMQLKLQNQGQNFNEKIKNIQAVEEIRVLQRKMIQKQQNLEQQKLKYYYKMQQKLILKNSSNFIFCYFQINQHFRTNQLSNINQIKQYYITVLTMFQRHRNSKPNTCTLICGTDFSFQKDDQKDKNLNIINSRQKHNIQKPKSSLKRFSEKPYTKKQTVQPIHRTQKSPTPADKGSKNILYPNQIIVHKQTQKLQQKNKQPKYIPLEKSQIKYISPLNLHIQKLFNEKFQYSSLQLKLKNSIQMLSNKSTYRPTANEDYISQSQPIKNVINNINHNNKNINQNNNNINHNNNQDKLNYYNLSDNKNKMNKITFVNCPVAVNMITPRRQRTVNNIEQKEKREKLSKMQWKGKRLLTQNPNIIQSHFEQSNNSSEQFSEVIEHIQKPKSSKTILKLDFLYQDKQYSNPGIYKLN